MAVVTQPQAKLLTAAGPNIWHCRKKETMVVPKELVIDGGPALKCIREEPQHAQAQAHVWLD